MREIEGQAIVVSRMIEDDRYCTDIRQQIIVLSSAADQETFINLQNHVDCCIANAIKEQESRIR